MNHWRVGGDKLAVEDNFLSVVGKHGCIYVAVTI